MPTDGNWGGHLPNVAWGGQVGLVVRNECDVAVGPLALTNDRVSAMRPLPAYFYADASHMAARREVYYSDVFGYIYAFDEQVCIGIVFALATVAILMVMFRNNFRFAGAKEKLLEYIFLLFAMLLTKGPSRCPKNTRVLIGVWWLAVVFATTSITSHMHAGIAIKTEVPHLESVANIIKHRHIVPTIIDGMAFDVFFKVGRLQPIQATKSFGVVSSNTKAIYLSIKFSCERLLKLYWMADRTRCICESGLLDRHLEQALLQTWRQAGNRHNTVEAIRAEDISGLFADWIMGMSMAAVGTIGEAVMEWRQRSGVEVSQFSLRRRRNRLKRPFPLFLT
ncbi:hypothetical protein MRX96_026160 [Rhipicephalus microplus]